MCFYLLLHLGCRIRFYGALKLTNNNLLFLPLQPCSWTCVRSFIVWLATPLISCLFTSCCCVDVCIHLANHCALQLVKNLDIYVLFLLLCGLLVLSVACILRSVATDCVLPCILQVCQISVQPPVNGELILRFQQLQSRLTTLKIENEEVKRWKNKKKTHYPGTVVRGRVWTGGVR